MTRAPRDGHYDFLPPCDARLSRKRPEAQLGDSPEVEPRSQSAATVNPAVPWAAIDHAVRASLLASAHATTFECRRVSMART
jgi:hypothetical protein